MNPRIILASTSPYRKKLLQQLGITFSCEAPAVDEAALKKNAPVSALDLPLFLAEKKADSVARNHPDAVVIGCDQMAFLDSEGLNKPGTKERAVAQLLKLQGRTHLLTTATVVILGQEKHRHVDRTTLHMRALTKEQITRYVDLESPLDCAGSYKIESLGIGLFEKIDGQDPSAIVGLPLMALTKILNDLKIPVP